LAQDLVLSASSVTTYLRCGTQWWFQYVEGVQAPPSLRAIRGIAAHAAVEVDMRQKMLTGIDLSVDDMLDAYATSWSAETVDGWSSDEVPGVVKDKGVELVRLYHRVVAPKIQPIMVEEPIQFTINDQIYSGQIDLAEEVDIDLGFGDPARRLVIRDTKTTARTPGDGTYLLNMTGYAISQRQKTGRIEADTVLDYLVALKEPKYKEIRMGGPITDEQIRQFAGVVGSVSESIKAGRFVPNGLVNGACGWCQFRQICPAYMEA
jgi:CRISPR/Cas system-associated exonuclease Cas4 (RecB family)